MRKENASPRPAPRRHAAGHHAPSTSLALDAFKRKTAGRCFVCLSTSHRASACRDPIRCFSCRRSGHREAHCRECRPPPRPRGRQDARPHLLPSRSRPRVRQAVPARRRGSSPTRRRVSPTTGRHAPSPPRNGHTTLPPLPRRTCTSKMARIGDPSTRPDEATYLVPTSLNLEQEVQEWEGTTHVVMAISAPPTTGP